MISWKQIADFEWRMKQHMVVDDRALVILTAAELKELLDFVREAKTLEEDEYDEEDK